MMNNLGNHNDETVIANNETEAKINAQASNPNSTVLEAEWVYK